MGMYDTMNQAATPQGQVANGSSFAQKQPMNPIMRGRPTMGDVADRPPTPSGNGQMQDVSSLNLQSKPIPAMGRGFGRPTPNPMQNAMGVSSGMAPGYMNKSKPVRPVMGGGIPSPGMGPSPAPQQQESRAQRPQYGLQDVASRVESERNPAPSMNQAPQMSPMQAAMEQMRDYSGPDLGSQDPREIARMQQQSQGQTTLQNAPYGGENPGSTGFQSMMEAMNSQRPDVMPRGLGPSYS